MKTLLILSLVAMGFGMNACAENKALEVGDAAPVLSGTTDSGQVLNFGALYQQQPYTLVYFYPKAKTPGCTAQGCSLRDAYADLTQKGVAVVGVSTDNVKTQAEFKQEQHFPFTLVADPDRKIINAFQGAQSQVPVIGGFAQRQAYLIYQGKIVYADHRGSTKQQAQDILNFLDKQPAKPGQP